jgi:hypothetical protein
MNAIAIQKAVRDRLVSSTAVTNLVTGIFDEVPQGQSYPYIVVGDDTAIEWDKDQQRGVEATITLHAWGRKAGRKEVKSIMDAMYDRLHRAELDIEAMTMILCNWEFGESFLDPDGITRHGVQRYRIIAEEANE